MSKMTLHPRFGHLKPKLWAKEGPGVKLAVWLPTIKSQESTTSGCPIWECYTSLKRSWWGLQLWFRPCRDQRSGRGDITSQSPKTPTGTQSGQFRDSNLGVLGICAIWMRVPRRVTKLTIGSMVVTYSRARLVMCQVSPRSLVVCPNTKRMQNGF